MFGFGVSIERTAGVAGCYPMLEIRDFFFFVAFAGLKFVQASQFWVAAQHLSWPFIVAFPFLTSVLVPDFNEFPSLDKKKKTEELYIKLENTWVLTN